MARTTEGSSPLTPDARWDDACDSTTELNRLSRDQTYHHAPHEDESSSPTLPMSKDTEYSRTNTSDTWQDPPSYQRKPGVRWPTILRLWAFELLNCVLAVASMIAIIAVLFKFNGRALSQWHWNVTLSTLLSILITITRAALVVPLAEGISQLKFSWFKEKDRTLVDTVRFDNASRGIFGATKLLFSIHPWNFASFGAVLFITSLAIGPFTQQVVQLDQRNVAVAGSASVPVCENTGYNDWQNGAGPGMDRPRLDTVGAIYQGIFQSSSQRSLAVSCSSGNCTFGQYQTLGFCSKCADITNMLTAFDVANGSETTAEYCASSTLGCIYRLPNNVSSDHFSATSINTTAINYSLSHPDLANITGLANYTAIYGSGETKTGNVTAIECTLYFCIQKHNGVVEEGVFNETTDIIPSTTKITLESPAYLTNLTLVPEVCYSNGTQEAPYDTASDCVYQIGGENVMALSNVLTPLLTGYGTYSAGRTYWSTDTLEAMGNYSASGTPSDSSRKIFSSLASTLTDYIRTSPFICQGKVTGTAWTMESFYSVRWAWTVFPIFTVVATCVFLAAVIIKTKHDHIWKSNPLALVFSGLAEKNKFLSRDSSLNVDEILKEAGRTKVRLNEVGRWESAT